MWDKKYRPLKFSDVLGQEGAVEVLKKRLEKGSALDTSYIFSGGHGQGKTTLARILARALLCERRTADQEPCNECDNCQGILTESSLAFYERDAASNGTVGIIRGVVDELQYLVHGAPKQIHLFDEAHRMSKEAQDVLLKPIEEKLMVGIFCTTEPDKIRGTIRSRCEEHRIRKITREDIAVRLKKILQEEHVEYEEDALFTVIDCSGGHVRDILNRLEMISHGGSGMVSLEAARTYLGLGLVSVYYDILLNLDNPAAILPLIDDACDRVGAEDVAVGLAEASMNAFRLANKMFAEFSYVDRAKAEALYKKCGNSVLVYARKFASSYEARTKVGLITDVVGLTTPIEMPRVQEQIHVAQPPSPPLKSQDSAPVSPKTIPAQASPPPPTIQVPQGNGKIGNVGEDPLALTSIDTFGVRKDFPRGHEEVEKRVVPASEKDKPLTANDWKRSFERNWRS